MPSKPLLTSKLLQRPGVLTKALVFHPQRTYNWGNYDASSKTCCKMHDAETFKCLEGKLKCKPTKIPNKCYKRVDEEFVSFGEYPKQLFHILRPAEVDCGLIKHDMCYYRPSDKSRRYQRTWPECPLIWLRPKKKCCPDEEYYPPICRRQRKPQRPPMTTIEKYLYTFDKECKSKCHNDGTLKRKCTIVRGPKKCEKVEAPFPSFSECKKDFREGYCHTECGCKLVPSLCDLWRLHHRNSSLVKKCTLALVGYCPFKNRGRPIG
ncbi:uncharacterized protein Dvir_GJ20646 [Drosophila virilis]|uniref:Uncharacterized protein n=1 Tax=Drosophila virilis TaxID=7244 RepID=B4LL93_DROVI|nr:uncharacterized protein LOC6626157 [Drosophila virilis]EDW60830.1 uncharacterized protein Dvir_GJ20646 [Drosophila virilis]